MHEGTEPDLAITLAIDFIRHSEDTKFVIFSDFMSSLEAPIIALIIFAVFYHRRNNRRDQGRLIPNF